MDKKFSKTVVLNEVTVMGVNMHSLQLETRVFNVVYSNVDKYSDSEFKAVKLINVESTEVKKELPIDEFIKNAELITEVKPKNGTITRTITYTMIDYLEVTIDNKLINHSVRVNSDLLLAQARKYVRESIPEKSIYRIDKLSKQEDTYRMSTAKYVELANKYAQQSEAH